MGYNSIFFLHQKYLDKLIHWSRNVAYCICIQQHKQKIGNATLPLLISTLAQTIVNANRKLRTIAIQQKFGLIAVSAAISSYCLSK